MRLRIERGALLKSLSHVQNVVERRTTIPILAHVRLDAGEGELALTATDLDLALAIRDAAEVLRAGATTAPAHLLFELVRKLPEGATVELEQEPGGGMLAVRTGRFTSELPTLPVEEFPALGEEAFDVTFAIPAGDLARAIDKVRFAISTEETRYYLNGIHFHPLLEGAASVLRAVATDGHRLARVEVPLPEGARAMPGIIVPRKAVAEMRKLLEECEEEVTIAVSPSRIRLDADGRVLISRLIDGQFPDYERVIPKQNDKIAHLATEDFARAVDRVSTIATERLRAVKLAFSSSTVIVSAVSAESGRASEEVDVEYEGEPLEIGFNARYILDILGEIEGEQARMEMTMAAAPVLVRDPGDPSVLYVLMPMRV